MIERVVIQENWQTRGHLVWVLGRDHPGAPTSVLQAPESGAFGPRWEPITEPAVNGGDVVATIDLPEGALDALVAAARNVQAPHPATERHLDDAIAVRDRLLSLVERKARAK